MDRMLYKMFVRLSDSPGFMAYLIAQRMKHDGLTYDGVAAEISVTPDQVGRLALCRPPRNEAYETDVQAIAAAVPMDAPTLIAWLSTTYDRDLIAQLDLSDPAWTATETAHPLPAEAAAHVPTDVKQWQPGDPVPALPKPHEVVEFDDEDEDDGYIPSMYTRVTCHACNGRGDSGEPVHIDCEVCDGVGYISYFVDDTERE